MLKIDSMGNGAAKKIGLEENDILVSINDQFIGTNDDLVDLLKRDLEQPKQLKAYRLATQKIITGSFTEDRLGLVARDLDISPELVSKIKELAKSGTSLEDLEASIPFVTTEIFPCREIESVLGVARGCTVRSKNAISDLISSAKSVVGGELKGYTRMVEEAREESILRMLESARDLGATAVIGVRFTSSTVGVEMSEMLVYGTAVRLKTTVSEQTSSSLG